MKQNDKAPGGSSDYQEIISRLSQKYKAGGQNLDAYLEGLFYTDYLNYWDYIQTDALLGLQNLRTTQPDELIFIVYHQSSELYFKLILSEIGQICKTNLFSNPVNDATNTTDVHITTDATEWITEKLLRICRYWQLLIDSFEVMQQGMDPEQFRKFRMALMPASGFQSFQYRQIEIASTDLWLLASPSARAQIHSSSVLTDAYSQIYWKQGAIEIETQTKTLTLARFEEKYDAQLLGYATTHQTCNIRQKMLALGMPAPDSELYRLLRRYDHLVNVAWPLAHLRAASHYLRAGKSNQEPDGPGKFGSATNSENLNNEDNPSNPNSKNEPSSLANNLETAIPATGGTNWQKYLAASRQKRIFFPELWSEQEKLDWGRN